MVVHVQVCWTNVALHYSVLTIYQVVCMQSLLADPLTLDQELSLFLTHSLSCVIPYLDRPVSTAGGKDVGMEWIPLEGMDGHVMSLQH